MNAWNHLTERKLFLLKILEVTIVYKLIICISVSSCSCYYCCYYYKPYKSVHTHYYKIGIITWNNCV